jgi:hypothetical protein
VRAHKISVIIVPHLPGADACNAKYLSIKKSLLKYQE